MRKDKTVRVDCTVVVAPTFKKAFLAAFHDSEGEKLGEAWLPYSRVTQVVRDMAGFTIVGEERGAEITIEIPQWLAEKDELYELIRGQILDQTLEPEPDMRDLEQEYLDPSYKDNDFDDDIPF